MKNSQFLLLVLTIILTSTTSAQMCKPDTTVKQPGVYPSGGFLDTVWIGESYSELVTYFSIKDTTIPVTISPYPTATVNTSIDSVFIKNYANPASMNLPPGLVAACNTSNFRFGGNTKNCIKISGLVSNISDTGNYLLMLDVEYKVTISSPPLTGAKYTFNTSYSPFYLLVRNRLTQKTKLNAIHALKVFPTSTPGSWKITGLPDKSQIKIRLISMEGKQVFQQLLNTADTAEQIITTKVNTGVYYLFIEHERKRIACFPVFCQ